MVKYRKSGYHWDDLEEYIKERSKKNSKFPEMVREAEERQRKMKCTCDFKERTKLLMDMLRTGKSIPTDSFGFRDRAPGECDHCYQLYIKGYSDGTKDMFE